MARTGKKEKVLTPEEKLAQALLPEAEQPYYVPENWCWIKLENASEIIMGQSPEGTATIADSSYMPLIGGAADMGEIYPKATRYTKKKKKISKKDDVILCIRATLGRPIFSDGEYCLGRGVAAIRSESLIKEYLRYGFIFFEQYLYDRATGTTFAQISSAVLQKMPFPLPPLAEQRRIVDRIESLFAKLDEAKEKAQAVVDGFENRKAAILHKAFTGELTAEWRKKNKLLANEWVDIPLEDVCSSIYDGDHMPPPKSENGIPFLVISNVNTGYLSFEDTRFVPQEYYDSLSVTRKPEIGDVLYTLVGSYGIPVVVNDSRSFCFQRHMALLKPSKVNPYFLWYQLQGQEFYNKATEIATGTAQLTVPIKGLRKLSISLPSESEQAEVVRILDDLFSKKQKVKETAKQVIDQIDVMKKSILARAFRGELGTNDPADESAEELLKRIL